MVPPLGFTPRSPNYNARALLIKLEREIVIPLVEFYSSRDDGILCIYLCAATPKGIPHNSVVPHCFGCFSEIPNREILNAETVPDFPLLRG